jgi:membrane fusion protein (multidrug efflux system)
MTKRIVWGGLAVVLMAVVVLRIVQASRGAPEAPEVDEIRARTGIPVEVAMAQEGPLVVRREFTGVLRGIRSATIRAKTGDEILEIPVVVGQRVRAGDVVIRQSSQGSMASVSQAEAAYEQAQRSLERLRPLHERGAISEQDWDNAQTALRVAEANREAARRSVDLVSPIDGIVTDILLTRGSMPESGDPLMRVSDLSRLQVVLQVSPEQARELTIRQPATVPAHGLVGTVSRVAMQADPESRLLEVELTFPGVGAATDAIRAVPGTLVTVQVEVGRRAAALLVPRAAVRDGVAWVVDADGMAHRREVIEGLEGDGLVEIVTGLASGEQVVVAGASLLSDGARTRIVGGATS